MHSPVWGDTEGVLGGAWHDETLMSWLSSIRMVLLLNMLSLFMEPFFFFPLLTILSLSTTKWTFSLLSSSVPLHS